MAKRRNSTTKSRALPYSGVCNLEHFEHDDLTPVFADMMPELFPSSDSGDVPETVPPGRQRRKAWEMAMSVRSLQDLGALRDGAQILGAGAGREWTGFYLTRFATVHMTDLYAGEHGWENAQRDMLIDPDPRRDGDWVRERLIVQHMDMRSLRYADGTFDGVFSSSSIEHIGTLEDMAAAAAEMGRVLKPGGVLTLATEFKLDGDGSGFPNVHLFTEDELQQFVVEPSGCEMAGEPAFDASEATRKAALVLSKANLEADRYERPHVVFINRGLTFTSVFLTLRKPE